MEQIPDHEKESNHQEPSLPTLESLDKEIFDIAFPTLATLAADPIAALVSTAWVGQLGATELAGVGVALSLYGSITKIFNMPLLAVITSSTASSLGRGAGERSPELGSAVSAAIIVAGAVGLAQAVLLGGAGFAGLGVWGAAQGAAIHAPAEAYLSVRAVSAPATVLFLSLQGAFRGLGDTKTPFIATLASNLINLVLEPLFIFTFGWGVRGAASAVAVSQAVSGVALAIVLIRRLGLSVDMIRGDAVTDALQYLRPTGLLTLRTIAITSVFAVATGLVARTDAAHAAAHQIAFQLWLASSLLADSLAVAAQALIARSRATGGPTGALVVNGVIDRVTSLSGWLGLALALGLTVGTMILPLPRLFSTDPAVLKVLALLLPAVILTQPINAFAFTMDGILYGFNGFAYAARAMLVSAAPAITVMVVGSRVVAAAGGGFDGQLGAVWIGLGVVMALRFLTIYLPLRRRATPFDEGV